MSIQRVILVVILALAVGLLSAFTVTQTVKAQYPSYSYPPTTPTPAATTAPAATSTPLPSATSSGTSLVLYEGPLTTGAAGSTIFGFGNTATDITSPGPTLKLQEGTTYTMTVYNVDSSTRHAWEIVPTEAVSNSPLFGAGIDITKFIPPGSSGSVTFTPNQTGNFYYVCTQPGHIGYGMYGDVVVTSAIPEFPTPLIFLLMLAVGALSALAIRQAIKTRLGPEHKALEI